MNQLSIDQSDGFSWFPSLLLLRTRCWELNFRVCVQSNHLHLVVLLPWQFIRYRVELSRLHLLPPLPAIMVSHVLEMTEHEDIGLTTWTYAHS